MDRLFISKLEYSMPDRAIVESMLRLTERVGAELVAEGVENDRQRLALLDIGVEYAQGFGLGKPMSSTAFEAWALARGDLGPVLGTDAVAC